MCLNLYPCAIKYYLISQPTHCQPAKPSLRCRHKPTQHSTEATRYAAACSGDTNSTEHVAAIREHRWYLSDEFVCGSIGITKWNNEKVSELESLTQPWISKITKTVKNREGLGCLNRSIGWVEVVVYVHRNRRFIRDGSPGRPLRLSHSSWALSIGFGSVVLHNVLGCRLTY